MQAPVPPGPAISDAMWRGIEVFRPLAVAYAAFLVWQRHDEMARPWVAAAVLVVLAAWSLAMPFVRTRSRVLVACEVGLASAAILASLPADGLDAVRAGTPTLPSIWPAAGVLCAAVIAGWRGGLTAAAVIGVVDAVEASGHLSASTMHNIVLLVLAGGLIGYSLDLAREGHHQLASALAAQERVRERERLARAVHDGVLQALALIHRRGAELGGPAAELGQLAGEQERTLRQLVSLASDALDGDDATRDVRHTVGLLEGARVHVSAPAEPVLLPARADQELAAAVGAALDNVARHAGPDAHAWVLVEGAPGEVMVTVRDNGSGMPQGRLDDAAREGRLGIGSSIRARLRDIGGDCTITSRPGTGTTVRMKVPCDLRPSRDPMLAGEP